MSNSNLLFADWYREADIQPTPQTITFRTDAVNAIIKKHIKIAFWLDITKLYLGYDLTNNSSFEIFCSEFKSTDPSFPLLENEQLVRVLAAICICTKLDNPSSYVSDALALAVLTSNFLKQFSVSTKIPVLEKSINYLEKDSIFYRKISNSIDPLLLKEISFEDVEIEEQEEEDTALIASDLENPLISLNSAINSIIEKVDFLTQNVKDQKNINTTLLEETNILWWVFGETSTLYKKHVKEIGILPTTFIAGYELSDFVNESPGYLSINSIIDKMLRLASDKTSALPDSSIYHVINSLTEEIRQRVKIDKPENLLIFTPIILGIEKSLYLDAGADWSALFKKACRANAKTKKNVLLIAAQVYYEYQFFKSFNLCSN